MTLTLSWSMGITSVWGDPEPPRGERHRDRPGNALGPVRRPGTGGRGKVWVCGGQGQGSAGRRCGGEGAGRREALSRLPGANSSPQICGVHDECCTCLLLEDLGDPALGTGTKSGELKFSPTEHAVIHPAP